MIKDIEINNFRCFSSAIITDARRLNVVVGANASGKTSLLEAIFLCASSGPANALRLRQWRGFEGAVLGGATRSIDDALWRDLFNNFNKSKDIRISFEGAEIHTRSLSISYQRPELFIPLFDTKSPDFLSSIEFYWRGPFGMEEKIRPEIRGGNLMIPDPTTPATETYMFAANQTYSSLETASRFSNLSRLNRSSEFVSLLRKEFPFIRDISIEILGNVPMLFAQTKNIEERIPLNLLSGGINKLASMLLSIPSTPKCLVLIDEIESGFYFERMPMIWRSLMELCIKYDAQVFATTHSLECLRAFSDACRTHPKEISVIRTERTENGNDLQQFWGSGILKAIQTGEIR